MATYRSFIAVDFPNQISRSIGFIQRSLKENIPSIVRWTNPENIHLTLKFLGDIESEKALKIEEALDTIALDSEPFKLELEGIGAFPNWKNPRIIWMGLNKSESLLSLVKQIEIYMRNLGCKSEEKPFLPHLTIGRVTDNFKREEVQNLEIKCSTFTRIAGITQITEIHLYKSELHRSGPVYTLIHSSPFQAPQ